MTDTTLINQPENLSILAPNTYSLVFARQPSFTYNLQRADLPSVTLGVASTATGPFTQEDFTTPGEKLTYDPLVIGLIVDEDLVAYQNLIDWQRECIVANGFGLALGQPLKKMSDATLILRTNKFNSNVKFIFKDVFPINLGVLSFDYSRGPDSPLVLDVTLNFRRFDMERVPT